MASSHSTLSLTCRHKTRTITERSWSAFQNLAQWRVQFHALLCVQLRLPQRTLHARRGSSGAT